MEARRLTGPVSSTNLLGTAQQMACEAARAADDFVFAEAIRQRTAEQRAAEQRAAEQHERSQHDAREGSRRQYRDRPRILDL
ncbi:MAG: hypothetical protein AAF355_07820 [Myxococcota bacterium]